MPVAQIDETHTISSVSQQVQFNNNFVWPLVSPCATVSASRSLSPSPTPPPPPQFRSVNIQHFIRKMLSKLILDLGKCPNQKTHVSESAGFLVWPLLKVQY